MRHGGDARAEQAAAAGRIQGVVLARVLIVSIVPYVAAFAVPAVVLGVLGLANAGSSGQGRGHALVAIVVGLAALVYWGGVAFGAWTTPIRNPYDS